MNLIMLLFRIYNDKLLNQQQLNHGSNCPHRTPGFNQIWIGCPRPACLLAGYDAIVKNEEDRFFIFSDRFIWFAYENQPLIQYKEIQSVTHVDAAFYYGDSIYAVKDGFKYLIRLTDFEKNKSFALSYNGKHNIEDVYQKLGKVSAAVESQTDESTQIWHISSNASNKLGW